MTPRIRVLPPVLADQIAAGEVVERPASVVKELVENALDAGARRIEVAIEGGGLQRITVTDDGCGMTPEEAHLSLKRHATSKLRTVDDLFTLSTMGFRGEALPSVAAVSKLALTTRSADAPDTEGAYRLEVEGGIFGEARAVGAPVGTEVDVRNLLGNLPARLKFMKAEATESAHVSETVLRLSLAFPTVHFGLRTQGRQVLELPPHPSGLERARVALGGSRTPVPLHLAVGEESGVHVEAYLGSPAQSAGTSRNTYPFVNRRFVRDRGLLQAILMGYGETLERGRYPLCVLHVTVRGESVDINVHPQKLEVRFARPQEVYAAARHAIARAVAETPWLKEGPGAQVASYALPRESWGGASFARDGSSPFNPAPSQLPRPSTSDVLGLFAPAPSFPDFGAGAQTAGAEAPHRFFSSLTYLGQLDRTYLVCEAPGELVLVDQHAAHERVAFQRLRDAHALRQVRTQRLLFPVTLPLDERLRASAQANQGLLAELGFELSPNSDGDGATWAVQAVPELLLQASPAEVLTEVLSELEGAQATCAAQERIDHVLATLACHSVVRAGDLLTEPEARALFEQLDAIDYRAHCPHGRPVLLRLSVGELERRFGRA